MGALESKMNSEKFAIIETKMRIGAQPAKNNNNNKNCRFPQNWLPMSPQPPSEVDYKPRYPPPLPPKKCIWLK